MHARLPFAALLLLVAAALRAQPAASVEERLARLEQQLARIESRLGAPGTAADLAPAVREFSALTQQLGWDGKSPLVVVKAAGKEQKFSIGGFVHAHAEFGDAPDARYTGINDRFLIRRARITFKGAFKEAFDFVLQPDFGNNSISGNTGYRGGFADAYLAWTKYEAANLQLGQFKTPFGFEQLTSDTKTLFTERAHPNDALTVGRQIGLGLLGTTFKKAVSYSVGVFNGNGVNNGNNDNDQFMYAGRVAANVWSQADRRVSVAVNGYSSADTGTFTGHRTGRGVDVQFVSPRLELHAEYLSLLQNRRTGTDTTADGWYALAAWFFVPKTLQGVVRYQKYDANTAVAGLLSRSWIFGASYYIKGDDLKLTFDYTLGDPAGPLKNQGRFMTRMQVVF